MPVCLLDAHIDAMDAVRASRIMDMAEATVYPHLSRSDARGWWRAVRDRMRAAAHSTRAALFSFNGVPMSGTSIKQALGRVLGGGFQTGD